MDEKTKQLTVGKFRELATGRLLVRGALETSRQPGPQITIRAYTTGNLASKDTTFYSLFFARSLSDYSNWQRIVLTPLSARQINCVDIRAILESWQSPYQHFLTPTQTALIREVRGGFQPSAPSSPQFYPIFGELVVSIGLKINEIYRGIQESWETEGAVERMEALGVFFIRFSAYYQDQVRNLTRVLL